MIKLISVLRDSLIGYRKLTMALVSLVIPSLLLMYGYDVSKLSWLATPLSTFFASNLVEHIPQIIQKVKDLRTTTKE